MPQPRPTRVRLMVVPLPCIHARTTTRLATFTGPGDWVALVRPFTLLRQRLRRVLWAAINARPDVDLFYGYDGVPLGPQSTAKPTAGFALLSAYDYIGLPLLIRGAALAALGGLRLEAGLAAGYDVSLRALGNGLVAEQLPLHFAHGMWPGVAGAASRRSVLAHWNEAAGSPWRVSEGSRRGTVQIRRAFAAPPLVSIVVSPRPEAGPAGYRLAPLLDALAQGDWPLNRIEVLADSRLDTGGVPSGDGPVRWRQVAAAPLAEPTDHSNALWRAAQSELVIFAGAGLVPETKDWIDALAGLAADRTVGMVSGRVMAGGQDAPDAAAAIFGFAPRTWPERGFVHREFAVPVSPLIAARKSMLETVNGFSPRVPPAYQAADAALRMRLLGQSVLVTPFASAQAGAVVQAPDRSQAAAFLQEWGAIIESDRTRFPDAPLRDPR